MGDLYIGLISGTSMDGIDAALVEFGPPVAALGLSKTDLVLPDMVFQMGVPPQRIDLLTSVTGLEFDEAWSTRRLHKVDTLELPFLGRAALLQNKRATGRSKDRVDVEILEQQKPYQPGSLSVTPTRREEGIGSVPEPRAACHKKRPGT